MNRVFGTIVLAFAILAPSPDRVWAQNIEAGQKTTAAPFDLKWEDSAGEPRPPMTCETREKNFLGLDAAPLEGPLEADRPDFTESPRTIPRGRIQLEGGYTYYADDEKGRRTGNHVFPEFLLRIGLVDRLEMRLEWEGWSFTEELFVERNDSGRRVRRKDHDDGGSDMGVGFKAELLDQRGFIPQLAFIGHLSLPTGAGGKTSGDVDPTGMFVWAYDLTEDWMMGGNINLGVLTSEKGRFFQPAASLTVGYSITEKLGAYTEYIGIFPNDRGSDCAHTLNGGFTYHLTDNLMFDIRAGVGLNEEADDFFIGTGFAIRL